MNTDLLTKGAGKVPQRKLALWAGGSLLLIVVFVGLAEGLGLAGIFVEGDAAASFANLAANEGRVRFGVLMHALVVLFDLVAAWALYLFLKREAPELSLLAGWMRLVYSLLYGAALFPLLQALQLVGGAAGLAGLTQSALEAQTMLALSAFRSGWDLAFIFFGVHLLVLGWAALRGSQIPRWIAWLLALGGLAYLFDYISLLLLGGYIVETSLLLGWGEVILIVWLLWKGGKHE